MWNRSHKRAWTGLQFEGCSFVSNKTLFSIVEVAMGDEDTVVLTPEEKDKILKDVPEDEQQDEEEED